VLTSERENFFLTTTEAFNPSVMARKIKPKSLKLLYPAPVMEIKVIPTADMMRERKIVIVNINFTGKYRTIASGKAKKRGIPGKYLNLSFKIIKGLPGSLFYGITIIKIGNVEQIICCNPIPKLSQILDNP